MQDNTVATAQTAISAAVVDDSRYSDTTVSHARDANEYLILEALQSSCNNIEDTMTLLAANDKNNFVVDLKQRRKIVTIELNNSFVDSAILQIVDATSYNVQQHKVILNLVVTYNKNNTYAVTYNNERYKLDDNNSDEKIRHIANCVNELLSTYVSNNILYTQCTADNSAAFTDAFNIIDAASNFAVNILHIARMQPTNTIKTAVLSY